MKITFTAHYFTFLILFWQFPLRLEKLLRNLLEDIEK